MAKRQTTVDYPWHKSFLVGNAAMCHGVNKIQKRLETSGFRKSEFRKLQNSESGNWISEFRIGKLDRETSEFRKLDFRIGKLEFWKSETGPGNFRIQNSGNLRIQNTSEFRKLDAIRYAIVLSFIGFGLSFCLPTPPRPIEDISVAFGLLYSLSTALSQSAVSYAHAAPGRPISDRLSPDTAVLSAVLSFALRNIY